MPTLPSYESLGSRSGQLNPASPAPQSRGGEYIGQALTSVGDKMMEFGIRRQAADDRTAYNHARNQLMLLDMQERQQVEQEHEYGDWDSKYKENYSTKRESIIGELRTQPDRDLLTSVSDIDMQRGSTYMQGAALKKETGVRRAGIDNDLFSLRQIADMSDSYEDVAASIEQSKVTLLDGVADDWLDAEEVGPKLRAQAASITKTWILKQPMAQQVQMLSDDSPFARMLEPEWREQRLDIVEARWEDEQASALASQWFTESWKDGGQRTEDVFKYIREQGKASGNTRAMNIALGEARQADVDRGRVASDMYQSIVDDVITKGENGLPVRNLTLQPLTPHEIETLGVDEQNSLRKWHERGDFRTSTNQTWYTDKLKEFSTMTLEQQAAEAGNLHEYMNELTESDYVQFRALVLDAEATMNGAGEGLADNFETASAQFDVRYGVRPTGDDAGSDQAQYQALYEEFNKNYFRAQKGKGDSLEDPDIQALLDLTFRKAKLPGHGGGNWYLGWQNNTDVEKFAVHVTSADIDTDDIPQALKNQYRKYGLTEVQMQEEYAGYIRTAPEGRVMAINPAQVQKDDIPDDFTAAMVGQNGELSDDQLKAAYANYLNLQANEGADRIVVRKRDYGYMGAP